MKTAEWLQEAIDQLQQKNISTARLDSLVLLEDETHKDRSWLLAHPEHEIDKDSIHKLNQQIERRTNHEPLAYIRGKSEFYGREFAVTPATLQPRPETETIISQLKRLGILKETIADIGTGSGAIAITIKLEFPKSKVYGTEIQKEALEVAQRNAHKLEVDITLCQGNLIEPLKNKTIDIIVANLPYVPNSHTINQAAMQEPAVAIFGGEDGLDLYRQLFEQIESRAQKPKFILTESLPFQHEELANIAKLHGYKFERAQDFIQLFNTNL